MTDDSTRESSGVTRRDVLKTASLASIAAALSPSGVFAAASERIRVGLIGCGGRGTGAAVDCLTGVPEVVIAALGDLFPDQLEASL
ncbi:MAG TPA: twin-arginine translocation signal domain-containing protein, partial [Vicinamibacteria bacterium]|nr:twin-arginine translocation signal domain-containing protein [Vicinamibacteria bacterium]